MEGPYEHPQVNLRPIIGPPEGEVLLNVLMIILFVLLTFFMCHLDSPYQLVSSFITGMAFKSLPSSAANCCSLHSLGILQ